MFKSCITLLHNLAQYAIQDELLQKCYIPLNPLNPLTMHDSGQRFWLMTWSPSLASDDMWAPPKGWHSSAQLSRDQC